MEGMFYKLNINCLISSKNKKLFNTDDENNKKKNEKKNKKVKMIF